MTEEQRLKAIAEIIEGVDLRCMAADGPVAHHTQGEMTDAEMLRIYKLAKGTPPKRAKRARSTRRIT